MTIAAIIYLCITYGCLTVGSSNVEKLRVVRPLSMVTAFPALGRLQVFLEHLRGLAVHAYDLHSVKS
jgi:hypothetical protein